MSSSRKHRESSTKDEKKTRTKHQDSPLAGGSSTHASRSVSRPQKPLASEAFLDRSRAQPQQSVLPSTNFRDNSATPAHQHVLNSANFRDDTKITSAYTTPEDVKMAEKQKKYTTLTSTERRQQDKWAHEKLSMYDNTCPAGFGWISHREPGYEGYKCAGGAHLVTHALLAEGLGGLYLTACSGSRQSINLSMGGVSQGWNGPIYPGQYGTMFPGMRNPSNGSWPMSRSSGFQALNGMRGYGSGNGGTVLPSAIFKDLPAAGPSRPATNQTAPPKEHSRSIPVSYLPSYGGRQNPNYTPPPGHGQPDYTIYPRPAAPRSSREVKLEDLLRAPVSIANDPSYRANYRTIISEQDKAMAAKQLLFDTLGPAERAVQKQWAKAHLKKTNLCPQGFGWWTFETNERGPGGCSLNGYRCWAGGHLVTHELLVEDHGRFYTPFHEENGTEIWAGPVYPRKPKLFPGAGEALVTLADEHGAPKWRDPEWNYFLFAPPGGSSSSRKKKKGFSLFK